MLLPYLEPQNSSSLIAFGIGNLIRPDVVTDRQASTRRFHLPGQSYLSTSERDPSQTTVDPMLVSIREGSRHPEDFNRIDWLRQSHKRV